MKNRKIFILIPIVVISVITFGFVDNYYFKINKAFEVFGGIFRIVEENYVLDVDPEILIKSGIEGMLNTLDPYTEYYDLNDQDDLEFISNASYTGLGITVSFQDSMLTIASLRDGYSAKKNGIRIGDRIYKINGTVVLNKSVDELRDYTKGEPGSKVNFTVLRDGVNDTISYNLIRENVKLDNISFSGMLNDSIGIIKLDRFTRTSAGDVKSAINNLKNLYNLKALILDLRDNPGGLMDASISICEIFLPKGSLIVTTKGKNNIDVVDYKSNQNPSEPNLPLAVLINERSASASEIVAGAVQDIDRGVIIGRRSYGKGLVQSVFEVPYKGSIKMTTAKYYTPSGRCIQRITFAEKYNKHGITESPDTNKYFTKNGRLVNEFTGIQPDSLVEYKEETSSISNLIKQNIIFNFVNVLTSTWDTIPKNFKVNDAIYSDFEKYITKNEYEYKTDLIQSLNFLQKMIENKNYSQKLTQTLSELKRLSETEELKMLSHNKKEIIEYIESEILSRFLTEKQQFELAYKKDKFSAIAINVMTSGKYNLILANKDSFPNKEN
jgi:carboxyl-terminal processing protease